jgi:hypothetical protein
MQVIFTFILIFQALTICMAFYVSPMRKYQNEAYGTRAALRQAAEILNVTQPGNIFRYRYRCSICLTHPHSRSYS